jgi:predicted nucleotidyltransferase
MAVLDEESLQKDRTLAEMVQRLVAAFQPERIYLYGSRARGEGRPDSDYDLFMVVSGSALPRYRRDQAAFRSLCGIRASKEIVVFTRDEFNSKLSVVCSLPATVAREGKLLYAT